LRLLRPKLQALRGDQPDFHNQCPSVLHEERKERSSPPTAGLCTDVRTSHIHTRREICHSFQLRKAGQDRRNILLRVRVAYL
jgi:hypothetical protein